MIGFIKKKIWLIRFQAKRSERSFFSFIIWKTWNWLDKQVTLLLDLLTLLLFIPVTLVIRSKPLKRNTRNALFVGLEHVVDKIAIRGEHFKEQGYEVEYMSFEYSGLRASSIKDRELIRFRKYLFLDILSIFKRFSAKPLYVEIYFEGNLVRQYLMSLLANRQHTVVASIDRGILKFDIDIQVIPFTYAAFRKLIYKRSTLILVRDPDKFDYLKQSGEYPNAKIVMDYNRVKIKNFEEAVYAEKNNHSPVNILFLNGFSVERSPETLVRAIPMILQKYPDIIVTIVGSRSELERRRVLDVADELNVLQYVRLYNWDPDAAAHYDEAVIYVMAAKFIYCNIALLEAMERGLVPIVSDVEKADLIVKDGANGFLFNDTAEDLSEKLILLIADMELRKTMGQKARATIIEEFNINERMNVIEEEIDRLPLFFTRTMLHRGK